MKSSVTFTAIPKYKFPQIPNCNIFIHVARIDQSYIKGRMTRRERRGGEAAAAAVAEGRKEAPAQQETDEGFILSYGSPSPNLIPL